MTKMRQRDRGGMEQLYRIREGEEFPLFLKHKFMQKLGYVVKRDKE